MLQLLMGTSEWLALAELRGLMSRRKLEPLIPSLVHDEFERDGLRMKMAIAAEPRERRFHLL